MKLCLVCSSGGHLFELNSLEDFWKKHERFWVTFPSSDVEYILQKEKVYFAYHPTNRNIFNLFRNFILAVKILNKERPNVVITSGAGVGVPFIYIAKMLSIKTIYIESLTRIKDISLSGKLVYSVTDYFLVQWPDLAKKYRKAIYIATNL